MKTVEIWSEFITLGQLIKLQDYVGSGAQVKEFLAENDCYINGELDVRRGRKIRPGDKVLMPDGREFIITAK